MLGKNHRHQRLFWCCYCHSGFGRRSGGLSSCCWPRSGGGDLGANRRASSRPLCFEGIESPAGLSGAEPDPGERTRCLSLKNTLFFDFPGRGVAGTVFTLPYSRKQPRAKKRALAGRIRPGRSDIGTGRRSRSATWPRASSLTRLPHCPPSGHKRLPGDRTACRAFARIVSRKQHRGYVPKREPIRGLRQAWRDLVRKTGLGRSGRVRFSG
jgi:hypothetical protein